MPILEWGIWKALWRTIFSKSDLKIGHIVDLRMIFDPNLRVFSIFLQFGQDGRLLKFSIPT